MASLPPRRTAWILLVAALGLPGWEVSHALIHRHLAHHHGEVVHHHEGASRQHSGFSASRQAVSVALFPDARAHEHGHLDAVLLPAGRNPIVSPSVGLSAVSPEPGIPATWIAWVARDREPPRASPEPADPSRPRAPPPA